MQQIMKITTTGSGITGNVFNQQQKMVYRETETIPSATVVDQSAEKNRRIPYPISLFSFSLTLYLMRRFNRHSYRALFLPKLKPKSLFLQK